MSRQGPRADVPLRSTPDERRRKYLRKRKDAALRKDHNSKLELLRRLAQYCFDEFSRVPVLEWKNRREWLLQEMENEKSLYSQQLGE